MHGNRFASHAPLSSAHFLINRDQAPRNRAYDCLCRVESFRQNQTWAQHPFFSRSQTGLVWNFYLLTSALSPPTTATFARLLSNEPFFTASTIRSSLEASLCSAMQPVEALYSSACTTRSGLVAPLSLATHSILKKRSAQMVLTRTFSLACTSDRYSSQDCTSKPANPELSSHVLPPPCCLSSATSVRSLLKPSFCLPSLSKHYWFHSFSSIRHFRFFFVQYHSLFILASASNRKKISETGSRSFRTLCCHQSTHCAKSDQKHAAQTSLKRGRRSQIIKKQVHFQMQRILSRAVYG